MEKLNEKAKINYFQKIEYYKSIINSIIKDEQDKLKSINDNHEQKAFLRLELAESMLNLVSYYLIINGISQSVLNLKNEDALNAARKTIYKSIIYLEDAVSNYLDAPYSEYENRLLMIETFTSLQRYRLVQKMGLSLQLLMNAYGENSKWKWSFVEVEGRIAVIAKNLVNLHAVAANSDMRSPNYEPTVLHLRLVKKLLMQAAFRHREMYEVSTNRIDDFKRSVSFLSALKRFLLQTGDQNYAADVKKKLDIWNHKLTTDLEKQKKKSKQ